MSQTPFCALALLVALTALACGSEVSDDQLASNGPQIDAAADAALDTNATSDADAAADAPLDTNATSDADAAADAPTDRNAAGETVTVRSGVCRMDLATLNVGTPRYKNPCAATFAVEAADARSCKGYENSVLGRRVEIGTCGAAGLVSVVGWPGAISCFYDLSDGHLTGVRMTNEGPYFCNATAYMVCAGDLPTAPASCTCDAEIAVPPEFVVSERFECGGPDGGAVDAGTDN